MRNPLEALFGENSRKYREIINNLKIRNYTDVLNLDTYSYDNRFGISDYNLVDKIQKKLEADVILNPSLFQAMIDNNYIRINYFINIVVKSNPNIVEQLINSKIYFDNSIILQALSDGYKPTPEFIESNPNYFNSLEILDKLTSDGYKPSNEVLEKSFLNAFNDSALMLKALNWGFIPTISFLGKCLAFKEEEVLDKLFLTYPITEEILTRAFYYNPTAQRKIIRIKPELLLNLHPNNGIYEQLWIEAIKIDYIPNQAINDYFIVSNFLLMSKIIKHKPEYIKYCKVLDIKAKEALDNLALAMGYLPTKEEVISSKYIQKSYKLMESAIIRRPELIKYIETRPLNDSYTLEITQEQFFILAELSIANGYIPTPEDIDKNPRLADSFNIMKVLIRKHPECLSKCRDQTKNIEELSKIALDMGYKLSANLPSNVLASECIIKQTFIETGRIFTPEMKIAEDDTNCSTRNYSLDLYNFFIENGCSINQIVHLFNGNFDVMKIIIKKEPSNISKINVDLINFNRNQIDELCLLAIDNGYVLNDNDKIFGGGIESAKIMIRKFPSFIEKTRLFDGSWFNATPISEYDELCQLAIDSGYIPDSKNMGYSYMNKYIYSYSIIKKALETNVWAITACLVKDKEKFDELCQIAITNGYKPNEYAITHYTQLNTNYDMMALVIPENPLLILESDLKDINELEALLKIAVDNGLDLNNLEDNQIMKLFLSIPQERWSIYLQEERIIVLKKSMQFYKNNDEIASTLNPKFLSDETISHFSKLQIEVLSCYPKLQEEIIKINSYYNKDNLKVKIIYKVVEGFKDNMEWIAVLETILKNINSSEFSNLFIDLNDKIVTDEDIKKIIFLLNYGNHLDISNYSDLHNLDKLREEYINILIRRNTVGSLKSAYLEKVFGIDLVTAINFVKTYGESLNGQGINNLDEEAKNLFSILNNIKNIINTNNTEILKKYINSVQMIKTSYDLMLIFESKLKAVYTREFNKSFTKPNEEDRINIEDNQYDIYYAAGKDGNKMVRLMITSIGAYTKMSEPDDYYASWNMSKIASHGVCCSYIGEKNLGTAEVKYCCLGFSDYEIGALQLSAPYDLCSYSLPDQYTISANYASKYLMPDDILEYTRHTHNETVWERRKLNPDESLIKKQPSYIVYFVDDFEDRLTNEDAKRQWESVKKAAANFSLNGISLPIMVVERKKIAKNQRDNIENMLNQFEQTLDKTLIRQIVVDFESNYAGNRNFHPTISDEFFPQSAHLNDSVVGRIMSIIKKSSIVNINEAVNCLKELENVILKEREKYANTQHGLEESLPSFNIEEALIEINLLKENLKLGNESAITLVNETAYNDRQYLQTDVSNISEEMINEQLTNEEVKEKLKQYGLFETILNLENEIYQEKINAEFKVHGQRHIRNVILFSGIIGSEVISNPNDLRLLLLSAKYHDIGRTTEGYQEHAKAGSKIAEKKLAGLCTLQEMQIIKTVIEFHEIARNDSDEVFESIATQNGLTKAEFSRCREIAEVLKDADALDRTRFINKARLMPELLKYSISKKLVRFSACLQETYALEDLAKYNCDEQISILLNNHTPQEVLRIIRKSVTSEMTNDDILIFIDSWSKNEEQNFGGVYGK